MKKVGVGASFFVLVLVCLLFKQFLLLINYMLALVLHELAHLYIATRRGYKLKNFKLDMFGLVIELDNTIEDKDIFAVNIAGPMLNLILCLICLALYTLFPPTKLILHNFCTCNFVLAMFNLLPVYPLDGGKIFRGIIKKDKTYKHLDFVVRIVLFVVFLILFIFSIFHSINFFYVIMCVFFVTAKRDSTPTFTILKHAKKRQFDKVNIVKASADNNLYDMLKQIKRSHYTIFYCNTAKPIYIDEDTLIALSLKYPLTTQVNELNKSNLAQLQDKY